MMQQQGQQQMLYGQGTGMPQPQQQQQPQQMYGQQVYQTAGMSMPQTGQVCLLLFQMYA